MSFDLPQLGTALLTLCLVLSSYAFVCALGSVRGRPHWLIASRFASYASSALVLLAVVLLAYAFQSHDFRIRYVARYSDRSMHPAYLLTALWGGQDGSLLWWSLLLCGYTTACVAWMRQRFLPLQPYVIATLQSILAFFLVLMLFAANPFELSVAQAPAEGEGMNPLLQNYWMMIHPPSLYLGFVGWAVPFAFAVAALSSGELGEAWIFAARRWALVAWLFLSIGLLLGMLWSYEELGWGGYWAWDPVENASFHPWLVGTAFLHSIIVQERYRMLKVWNLFLICFTFFMTIFGTFLTRSGLIASVHSFARSDIGIYFTYYLVFLAVFCTALLSWRRRALSSRYRIESLLSREFAFLFNNWILLGMMFFVLVATTFPLLSEWLRGEEVTVGPSFYNRWMVPLGLVLLVLMGTGPLIAWRKASGKKLMQALRWPLGTAVVTVMLHVMLGNRLGFPALLAPDAAGSMGAQAGAASLAAPALQALQRAAPAIALGAVAFVIAAIVQEFARGVRARLKRGDGDAFTALYRLVARARRRYGGYTVHLGIALMYIGFVGAAYDKEQEAALYPGQSLKVAGYRLRYDGVRTEQDGNKRMLWATLRTFTAGGKDLGSLEPAKFIYRTHPNMPTTEVAIRSSMREDIYAILSNFDPESKRVTLRVIVRPLVFWIWLGGLWLIFGTAISLAPSTRQLLQSSKQQQPLLEPWPATAGV